MSGFGGRYDWLVTGANAAGLAVAAASGLLVSVLLANGAGASAVGQFNQLLAVYIVSSQFAALGVHLSVLHFIPGLANEERPVAARASVLAVCPPALVTTLIVWASAGGIESVLDSPDLSLGVELVAIATGLFALNKLLLNLLNVYGHLIWLAIAQALRPVAWLVVIAWQIVAGEISVAGMGGLFVAGEIVVMVFALARTGRLLGEGTGHGLYAWTLRHWRFGVRAFPSNAITELNTRVDVLVLGVFASDQIVGVYSFAALIAEGVFQIGVFMRTIINNRLVAAVIARDQSALSRLLASVGRAVLLLSLVSGIAAWLLTPLLIDWFGLDPSLHSGSVVLALLLAGVIGGARFSPFWNVLLLAGRPGAHSLLMSALLLINLALNAVAIPLAGMNGAGGATALTLLVFPFILRIASRQLLGLGLRVEC